MEKNKTMEMTIYEMLGIKTFRKMAFALRDTLNYPATIGMTKEERKRYLYKSPSNYNIGKIKRIEDLERFKKMLYLNAGIHIVGLSLLIPDYMRMAEGTASIQASTYYVTLGLINSYCIMLQRYNYIRLNILLKKMKKHFDKDNNGIREELRTIEASLPYHTFSSIDENENETSTSFEELITNADRKKLEEYRQFLERVIECNREIQESEFNWGDDQIEMDLPIEKRKNLRLTLRNERNRFSAMCS